MRLHLDGQPGVVVAAYEALYDADTIGSWSRSDSGAGIGIRSASVVLRWISVITVARLGVS